MDSQDREQEIKQKVSGFINSLGYRQEINIRGAIADVQHVLSRKEKREVTHILRSTNNDLSRREFLKLLGIGAGGLVAGSALSTFLQYRYPTTPTGRATGNFSNTVDLGAEGLNRGDNIAPLINQHAANDTLLEIPSGEYKLSSNIRVSGSNWGIAAADGCKFTSTGGGKSVRFQGSKWQVRGILFDNAGGNIGVNLSGADWRFDNCAHTGPKQNGMDVVYGTEAGSKSVISRYFREEPKADRQRAHYQSSLWMHPSNHGDVWLKCCHFRHFNPRNAAVYGGHTALKNMRRSKGTTHCEECYFYSCHGSNIKSGDFHGKQTHYKNSVFHVKDAPLKGRSKAKCVNALTGENLVENCNIKIEVPGGTAYQGTAPPQLRNSGMNNKYPKIIVNGGAHSVSNGAQVQAGDVTLNDVGDNPSTELPACVPKSPEESTTGELAGDTGGASRGSSESDPC